MASFGDAANKDKNKDTGDDDGFVVVTGGTLLVEVAVDPKRLEVLYEQVKQATRRAVLDGYAAAAAQIATADDPEVGPVVGADGGTPA